MTLQQLSTRARAMISELGARFIRHGSVVMTHAYSRVVLEVFKKAVSQVGTSSCILSSIYEDLGTDRLQIYMCAMLEYSSVDGDSVLKHSLKPLF